MQKKFNMKIVKIKLIFVVRKVKLKYSEKNSNYVYVSFTIRKSFIDTFIKLMCNYIKKLFYL